MLLKIDYGAKDKKQFNEIHIDLPGLKASDPSLFASIKYVNKETGVTSEAQLISVTELCDPEDDIDDTTVHHEVNLLNNKVEEAEIINEEPIIHEENKSPKRRQSHN